MATTVSGTSLLDVPSLVSQLMAIERQPIDKLNSRISTNESKISQLGKFTSLISALQSSLQTLTSKLQGFKATSSDANAFTATADSTAVAGNYNINVGQLAKAQTLAATGQASPTAAIGGAAPSTLTFTVNGIDKTVSIAAGATLNDIRDAINAADIGLTANVINDGTASPYRLTITADQTGTVNAVTTVSSDDAGINALLAYGGASPAMTQTQTAQNASVTVNGVAISSASNTISGALQGVTLTLRGQSASTGALTLEHDNSAVATAIDSFVSAYNALYSEMKTVSAFKASATASSTSSSTTSSTSTSATTPIFAGDATVRSMMNDLRNVLTTAASGTYSFLSQVGISLQKDGSLKVDSTMLETALSTNYSAVSDLFASASGFATRLNSWGRTTTQVGGTISLRQLDLAKSVSTMNDQISKLEVRMAALKKQYTTTYSNLNMFLAQSNSTTAYLTQQFS